MRLLSFLRFLEEEDEVDDDGLEEAEAAGEVDAREDV